MVWERYIKKKAQEVWDEIQQQEINGFSWEDFRFNYRAEHNTLVLSIGTGMGKELDADMEVLKAAILLHDIGRSVVKKGHGEIGAKMAGEILKDTDFPPEKISAVEYAISAHVGWDESIPETLEARILWDADKLSKLGVSIVLQRAMLLPLKGKNIWDAIADFDGWLKQAGYIKDHMKTPLGSKMAQERYQTLLQFVKSLKKELTLNHIKKEDPK